MHNQAQVLLKRSCTLEKLVNTHTKGITLLCIGKNNICISCVFNGFKYSNIRQDFGKFQTSVTIYIYTFVHVTCANEIIQEQSAPRGAV